MPENVSRIKIQEWAVSSDTVSKMLHQPCAFIYLILIPHDLFPRLDISMAHVAMWQAQDAYYLFVDCEKSLPVRHLDINMVRLPFAIRLVLEFVKTLLSKKIRQLRNQIQGTGLIIRSEKILG